jgi:aryl-alcohol dehydrogenase-like predicted oxidoreductase/enamine deaminase RidA (YjgF/YER057c/UK114 family)
METTRLAGDLTISRILTGLWQVADQERTAPLDTGEAARHLADYARAGFTTFDMADHYGSAELIAGRVLATVTPRPLAFTKWCPEPGPMTAEVVRAGVEERCRRLGVDTVDLLQLHWWTFEHPAWLDALHELQALRHEGRIRALGVTNFDAAHLALAAADGIELATNQVSFSLLDRRAAGPLAEVCARTGTRLLAYGTLCGGFLSECWVGAPEPAEVPDWSRMKYRRFIDAAGGWAAFQRVLGVAAAIAGKHGVSVANVATRWVLDQPHVAGVIVGARLGEREHRADNLRVFSLAFDEEDRARLDEAFAATTPIPGDCGDEYRRPPYLTASGDLSHHLAAIPSVYEATAVPGRPGRLRVSSGSRWEPLAGYSRAVRVGDRILVSGTTATHGTDRVVAPGDAGAQTTYILDKILAAVRALGGAPEDIVRTRVALADPADVEAVSIAHGRVFGDIRPANTLYAIGALIGDYRVEIDAEAVVD